MCHNANYLCSGEDLRLGVQANHAEVLHVVLDFHFVISDVFQTNRYGAHQ